MEPTAIFVNYHRCEYRTIEGEVFLNFFKIRNSERACAELGSFVVKFLPAYANWALSKTRHIWPIRFWRRSKPFDSENDSGKMLEVAGAHLSGPARFLPDVARRQSDSFAVNCEACLHRRDHRQTDRRTLRFLIPDRHVTR
jgi:hypothetical protein